MSQIAMPGSSPCRGGLCLTLGLVCWSMSVTTTILVTILIVSRLLLMRYRIRKVMGPEHESPYVSISAMLIESALLYSTVGLIFIISFAKNNAAANLFLPLIGQVQVQINNFPGALHLCLQNRDTVNFSPSHHPARRTRARMGEKHPQGNYVPSSHFRSHCLCYLLYMNHNLCAFSTQKHQG